MSKNSQRLLKLASKAIQKAVSSGALNSGNSKPGAPTDWRAIVRSAADSITGDNRNQGGPRPNLAPPPSAVPRVAPAPPFQPADRIAIAKYDYLVKTADSQHLERIHQNAFAALTPEQRVMVERRMNEELPAHERPKSSSPNDLAWAAARAETMRPGRMRGLLARAGSNSAARGAIGGVGAGMAGGLLLGVAGGAIASAAAAPLLEQAMGFGVSFEALANTITLESIAGSLGGFAGGAGDAISGLGEQAGSFGDRLNNPGGFSTGDFFNR